MLDPLEAAHQNRLRCHCKDNCKMSRAENIYCPRPLGTLIRSVSDGVKRLPRLRILVLRCLPTRRGKHIPDQGKALGRSGELNQTQALKGRHKCRARPWLNPSSRTSSISCIRHVSPLQGWGVMVGTSVPRALPWADLLRPLRGQVENSATRKPSFRVGMGCLITGRGRYDARGWKRGARNSESLGGPGFANRPFAPPRGQRVAFPLTFVLGAGRE